MFRTPLVMIGICALLGAKTAWADAPASIELQTVALGADSADIRQMVASHVELAPDIATLAAATIVGGTVLMVRRRRVA